MALGPTVTLTFAGDSKALDKTLGDVGAKTQSFGDRVSSTALKVGAGGVAAGAGLEAFARQQAPLTEGLGRVSMATGLQTDELRGLVKETSNVTFPLDEVIGLMELGAQQGLESGAALQQYATFWDTVGDATGENAVALGEAGVALRAVGIAAGEEEQALAAFGYITQGTTQDVGDFLSFLERTGPQLREMGMDIDDAAAVLGVLEHEFGMTGRTARQEFRSAVNESDGDLGRMLETLGVTEDQLGSYRGEVEASGDVIQGLADNHAESYTALQHFKHWVDETLFSLGEYGDVAAALALPLLALGPISTAVAGFFRLMGSQALINGARMAAGWLLAMGPIGIVIVAVGALVAAFMWAWNNVDGFADFFRNAWSWIKNAASDGANWVGSQLSRIRDGFNSLIAWFQGIPGRVGAAFRTVGEAIASAFRGAFNRVAGFWNRTIGSLSFTIPGWVPGMGGSGFSMPRMPTFHTGGRVPGQPGSEVLALLKAGERVIPEDRTGNNEAIFNREVLDGMSATSRDPGGPHITVNVNGSVLSERELVSVIRNEFDRGGFRGVRGNR